MAITALNTIDTASVVINGVCQLAMDTDEAIRYLHLSHAVLASFTSAMGDAGGIDKLTYNDTIAAALLDAAEELLLMGLRGLVALGLPS